MLTTHYIDQDRAAELLADCDTRSKKLPRGYRCGQLDCWHAMGNALMALGLVNAPATRQGTGPRMTTGKHTVINRKLRADALHGVITISTGCIAIATENGRVQLDDHGEQFTALCDLIKEHLS